VRFSHFSFPPLLLPAPTLLLRCSKHTECSTLLLSRRLRTSRPVAVVTVADLPRSPPFLTVVLVLVAIIFPPAAAAFLTGCSCDLLINIALSILGFVVFFPLFLPSSGSRRLQTAAILTCFPPNQRDPGAHSCIRAYSALTVLAAMDANRSCSFAPPSTFLLPPFLQWLIYKNAQAEERYGKGNFTYVGNATYGKAFSPAFFSKTKLTDPLLPQNLSTFLQTNTPFMVPPLLPTAPPTEPPKPLSFPHRPFFRSLLPLFLPFLVVPLTISNTVISSPFPDCLNPTGVVESPLKAEFDEAESDGERAPPSQPRCFSLFVLVALLL
jgi:uncharacterized membrane protein YqaE (UPF0057 family)